MNAPAPSTIAERDLSVEGELGLHARPAADFAKAAARFDARVTIAKGDRVADATSVLLVLTLDVRRGDRVHLRAEGRDARAAVEELTRLLEDP